MFGSFQCQDRAHGTRITGTLEGRQTWVAKISEVFSLITRKFFDRRDCRGLCGKPELNAGSSSMISKLRKNGSALQTTIGECSFPEKRSRIE
jgi:hypothetical protein